MAYIERAITHVLKRRAASSKCVLVTGARQVGKSTLIKHEFQNYHRANFDDRLTRLQARGQFILSGSQRLELMKGMSESLAGRVSVSELTGLSMREIYGVKFNQHFIPSEEYMSKREQELTPYYDIWEIIHKGSYPELYDMEREWEGLNC